MIWTVAKKELRGYFNSAVALIFLGAFLAGVLYTFFWHEKFFVRGLADLRPLFEWMPKLLIILVSALSMRLWAEERYAGTLEVLLTLPIPRWRLVAGKFVAGMLLIAIALALTLGIPLTVAHMGNLDTGPVIGGYLATLLLSAAYLVIGMCVSAATSIQIVAFVGTALVCGATYLVGELGDIGRLFGTGTRFESVARGVLDLRDVAYYAGIVALGFAINVALLGRLSRGNAKLARKRRFDLMLTIALIAGNAIALVLWMAPVRRARIDLTQDGTYSLSSTTKQILSGLDEKLTIRAYLSEKSHPYLEKLGPQLRDVLDEYELAGGSKVKVEIVDPTDDEDLKRDAKDRFEIKSQALPRITSAESAIVNAYFSIAIQQGNRHEVLTLLDLIEFRQLDLDKIDVQLRNVEYQITKTIKKVTSGFNTVDAMLANARTARLVVVASDGLPEGLKDAPDKLKKVADEIAKDSGNKLVVARESPRTEQEMAVVVEKYNVPAYELLTTGARFMLALVLEIDGKPTSIQLPETLDPAQLKKLITDGIKHSARGVTKVIGMWAPRAPQMPPGMEQMGIPPQRPPQTFSLLRQRLASAYDVRDVMLSGPVEADVDVLLLCGPADLDAKAVQAIDQFVMRGGALVVLDGKFRLAPSPAGIGVEKVTTGLDGLFEAWGIKVPDQMVLDTSSDTFPIPRMHDYGDELEMVPYPWFPKVTGRRVGVSLVTGGLPGSVLHFVSPVEVTPKDDREVDVLLESSDESWLSNSTQVNLDEGGTVPAPPAESRAEHPLAVTVLGNFATTIKKGSEADPKTKIIERTSRPVRMVVIGSSVFATDALQSHAEQFNQELAKAGILLVLNAIDWAVADTDLLAIRSRNTAAHALTLEPEKNETWRIINAVIALLALTAVIAMAWLRRRAVRPVIGGAS